MDSILMTIACNITELGATEGWKDVIFEGKIMRKLVGTTLATKLEESTLFYSETEQTYQNIRRCDDAELKIL